MAILARLGLTLKSWLVAAAGFIAVVGVLAIAWLKQSRDEWKDKAEQAEDELDWQDDLRTIEVKNETKSKARREQAKEEMADGKVPGIFKRHT